MKVVVLKEDTVINGCRRVKGELVSVPDGFNEANCKRVVRRGNPSAKPVFIEDKRDEQIAELKKTVKEKDQKLADTENVVKEKDAELAVASATIKAKEKELAAIKPKK
jgi:predicted dinucleotide-utilizing enzyme